MSSEFLKWFTLQYGERKSKKSLTVLYNEVIVAQSKYELARCVLDSCRVYDSKRDAALKAWRVQLQITSG